MVIHWASSILDSKIWNPNHPSTLHDAEIDNLTAPKWDIVCVWTTIKDSTFEKWVKISGNAKDGKIIIENATLWEWVSVNSWAIIKNSKILIPNFYVGKWVELENEGEIKSEEDIKKLQQKYGEKYQITPHSIVKKESHVEAKNPIMEKGEEIAVWVINWVNDFLKIFWKIQKWVHDGLHKALGFQENNKK